MPKPVIFTISAAWDAEASVWSGHCDDIPAAADAQRSTNCWRRFRRWRSTCCLTIIPTSIRSSLFLQITALREAEPAAA